MVLCPKCGHDFVARAPLGQGTLRGKGLKLNENRNNIMNVFQSLKKPLSVRDVQIFLVKNNVKRVSKRGAGWNYHTVQADLSCLLGSKHLEMVKVSEIQETFGSEGFGTNKVPLYRLRQEVLM